MPTLGESGDRRLDCRARTGGRLVFLPVNRGDRVCERYLGTKQDLVHAPNDAIKLKLAV
jgi:hypothetical protein